MSVLRRRISRPTVRVAVASADDMTVDLLRFVASGVTLAMAVFLTLVR